MSPGTLPRTKFAKRSRKPHYAGRRMNCALIVSGLLLSAVASAEELAEPALPAEFLDKALRVDASNHITLGRTQTPLTHRELYVQLGRTELVAQSELLAARRNWLIAGSVGLASAAIVTGVILIATAPKLASPACESSVQIYNEFCVPRANQHNISGTAVIIGGVVGALLMAGFAYNSDPRVLDVDQTASLVSSFNSRLARQLRRPPAGLRFLPMVTPEGATLTASLRF